MAKRLNSDPLRRPHCAELGFPGFANFSIIFMSFLGLRHVRGHHEADSARNRHSRHVSDSIDVTLRIAALKILWTGNASRLRRSNSFCAPDRYHRGDLAPCSPITWNIIWSAWANAFPHFEREIVHLTRTLSNRDVSWPFVSPRTAANGEGAEMARQRALTASR